MLTILENNLIKICIDNDSKFFDNNRKEINKNNLIGNKCVCLIKFNNNKLTVKQFLILS